MLFLLLRSVPPAQIAVVLTSAPSPFLLAAFALTVPNLLVQVWKWHYILRLAHRDISLGTAYTSLIVGFPLGFVTPGRLGEIGRAFYVKNVSPVKTFKLVIFDKVSNLAVTVLAGATGLLAFDELHLALPAKSVLLAGLLIISALVLHASVLSPQLRIKLGRLLRIQDLGKRNMAMVLAFSLLFYGVYLMQFLLLVRHFGATSLWAAAGAATVVFLSKSLLPIGFADLGVREGAAVFFLGQIGVTAAASFNAAFCLFIFNVACPTLLGLPILLRTKRELC